MAVSLRREKLEEDKEHGQQYNYRLIFRTSEVSLLWIFHLSWFMSKSHLFAFPLTGQPFVKFFHNQDGLTSEVVPKHGLGHL